MVVIYKSSTVDRLPSLGDNSLPSAKVLPISSAGRTSQLAGGHTVAFSTPSSVYSSIELPNSLRHSYKLLDGHLDGQTKLKCTKTVGVLLKPFNFVLVKFPNA